MIHFNRTQTICKPDKLLSTLHLNRKARKVR